MLLLIRRVTIVLLCCLLLALSWWRSPLPHLDQNPRVTFTPLDVADLPAPGPGLALEAAWVVKSTGDDFGSYSALVSLGNGGLLAVSDRGRYLRFADPSSSDPQPRMGRFLETDENDKRKVDCESLTRDAETGQLWAGYEQSNAIVRADPQGRNPRAVHPAAMRDWPSNGGPEAMVRLADGRFIVLSESRDGWFETEGPGLLFPSDPVDGAKPMPFQFDAPSGYLPTDMAQLPDGRVLILLRHVVLAIPPRFTGKILVADPAQIRKGQAWRGKDVADLAPPLPTDNFEGLAVEQRGAEDPIVWVISDDNNALFQRTVLLKLRWVGARGTGARADEKGAR